MAHWKFLGFASGKGGRLDGSVIQRKKCKQTFRMEKDYEIFGMRVKL